MPTRSTRPKKTHVPHKCSALMLSNFVSMLHPWEVACTPEGGLQTLMPQVVWCFCLTKCRPGRGLCWVMGPGLLSLSWPTETNPFASTWRRREISACKRAHFGSASDIGGLNLPVRPSASWPLSKRPFVLRQSEHWGFLEPASTSRITGKVARNSLRATALSLTLLYLTS